MKQFRYGDYNIKMVGWIVKEQNIMGTNFVNVNDNTFYFPIKKYMQ